jgi:hypothetical protein
MKFAQWAGWIVAAVFVFLYFKSCQAPPQVVTTAKGDSTITQALRNDSIHSAIAATYFGYYTFWRNKYDSLYESLSQKENQIANSANKIKTLIDSFKYYKSVNDTLLQLKSCGELIQQDSIMINLLFAAKVELDSAHAAHQREQEAADSTLYEKNKQIDGLKTSLFQLHVDYTNVVNEENVYIKKAKTASLWVKILGVTTAIFGAKSIIK